MNAILAIFGNPMSKAVEIIVDVLLLILLVGVCIALGSLIAEYFTERRRLKVCLPVLMEEIRKDPENLEECIRQSGLLRRQKEDLLELTKHPDFSASVRDALAITLLEEEREYWYKRIKLTDLMAKLGPILGLLGTLIPLGPGLTSLSEGNVDILAASLTTAFNTTIVGLISAAIAMIISYIRRKWYAAYMPVMETLTECVLEVVRRD